MTLVYPDYMQLLSQISMLLFNGYLFTMPILVILYILYKRKRAIWLRLIVTCNIVLLATALFSGTLYVVELFAGLVEEEESNTFRWRVMGPYWYTYWIMVIGQLLLPHLFWVKPWRWNKWIGLVVWFGISLEPLFSRLILYSGSLYRDYLPSSWVYYGPSVRWLLFCLGIYAVLIGLTYFVIKKRTDLLIKRNNV